MVIAPDPRMSLRYRRRKVESRSLREPADLRMCKSRGIERLIVAYLVYHIPPRPHVLLRNHKRRLVWSLAFVSACGNKVTQADKTSMPQFEAMARAASPALVAAERAQSASGQGPAIASAFAAQKLIRSGELQIQVKDVRKAVSLADSLARIQGGLLADSRQSEDAQGRSEAHLVVRVPSDRFAAAVAALRQLGDVKGEAVNTQDITKEYADLTTRLAVKEQTVARLRSLLDNRTAKLSDVLEVERELARNVTELEQFKGEQRFYDHQVAISSIAVTVFDRVASRGSQLTGPIASAFASSLEVLGTSIGSAIYVIVFLLPWAVVAAICWWGLLRVRDRARRMRRDTPPTSADVG